MRRLVENVFFFSFFYLRTLVHKSVEEEVREDVIKIRLHDSRGKKRVQQTVERNLAAKLVFIVKTRS